MKRILFVMAALLIAAAPATRPRTPAANAPAQPPVAGDWSSYVRLSPVGTYVVGNPRALVRIVEHLSYTCPHCAAFSRESAPVLRGQMIKSGSVEIEYRPTVRDPADLAASILLRCAGPKRFAQASEAVFAHQDDWLPLAYGFLEHDAGRFSGDSPMEQLKIIAQISGLSDVLRGAGMTGEEIDRCFADKAMSDQILKVADASRKTIKGTPTFFLNGTQTDAFTWSGLEPLLRAKGAK